MWEPLLASIILTSLIVFLVTWYRRTFPKRKNVANLGTINLFSLLLELIGKLF